MFQIHLGSDIWIDVVKWDGLVIKSGNISSLFARNAPCSAFGVDILKTSSITGKYIAGAFEYCATKLLQPPMNVINVQHYKTCIPLYIGKFGDDLRAQQRKERVCKVLIVASNLIKCYTVYIVQCFVAEDLFVKVNILEPFFLFFRFINRSPIGNRKRISRKL